MTVRTHGLPPSAAKLLRAVVVRDVVAEGDPLLVRVESFGPAVSEAVSWPPIEPLPKAGDEALALIDETGVPWIVQFVRKGAPTWLPLTFGSNWQNYQPGGEGVTFSLCAYARIGAFVHLDGIAAAKAAVTFGTTGTAVVGTLPVGFRPAKQKIQSAMGSNASGQAMIRVDILTTGAVCVTADVTGKNATTAMEYLSLTGLVFPATH